MEPDRPSISRIGDRPVTRWRREQDSNERPQSFTERPSSGVSRPHSKMERPTSRRGIKTDISEYGISRPPTSGKNVLSRPPSTNMMVNRIPTPSSRVHTISSANLSRVNSGLPRNFAQSNAMILDRPITQQGLTGVRIGSSKGVPRLTKQIEDKLYYKQLLQLKIQELNQEITSITNEVEKQRKDNPIHPIYGHRAREVTSELTELQDQLGNYNMALDKMTAGIDRREIEYQARELKELNDFEKLEMERISNKQQLAMNKLNELTKQIEARQKIADRFVEMDADTRQKFNEAQKQKIQVQKEIDELQAEYNQLAVNRSKLEQKIASSPIKQEACKLFMKIFEAEQKKKKLLEENENNLSGENIAEKQIIEIQKKIADAEQELQQLETDPDEMILDKQNRYNVIKKQDNRIDNIALLEKNKGEELEKLNRLEELIVEKLENISSSINENLDSSILNDDEMEMIQTLMNQDFENRSEKDFEELKQDSIKLCETIRKLEMLELKVCEGPGKVTGPIATPDDSETSREIEKKQKKLLLHKQDLNGQEKKADDELEPLKSNYNDLAELFQKNEAYRSISILEDKLEKVKYESDQFDQPIKEDIEKLDDDSLMKKLFSLTAQYNTVLINEMKLVY